MEMQNQEKEEDQTCYPCKLMYTLCVTQAFKLALSFLGVVTKYRVILALLSERRMNLGHSWKPDISVFLSEQIPAK